MNGMDLTKTMAIITWTISGEVQALHVFTANRKTAFMARGGCKPSSTFYIMKHIFVLVEINK